MSESIRVILEDLTGQHPPIPRDGNLSEAVDNLLASSGVGFSQFNELLLLLGYDRMSAAFFEFLCKPNSAFGSLADLRRGVNCFRERAILRFGNIRYAFKHLSSLSEQALAEVLNLFDPVDESKFTMRHDPLVPLTPIPGDQTYLLGYLIKQEMDERLQANPNDPEVNREMETRQKIVDVGMRNHEAYLASDHMDVYVATSMRERHEYQMVSKVVEEVFADPELKKLKVRWFDPTQAYCEDRIDKGLVEGLMLKRATCTLYLAQESDTLGKDSELASTLAQGKPVIAYIPSLTINDQDEYVENLLALVRQGSPGMADRELLLHQLRVFRPDAAWHDEAVISWVTDKSKFDVQVARQKLGTSIREHYNRRANTLKQSHPLGIQVHLATGVANGLLIARSTAECANLIHRILTNTLEFRICEKAIDGKRYLLLKEKLSESVFRVVTGDEYLTNAFWNFYLTK